MHSRGPSSLTPLRRQRPDRLERIERALLGLALVLGVTWAVAGSQLPGLLAALPH